MLPRGLLKEYSRFLAYVLRGLDVAAIVIAGLLAYHYKFGNLDLSRNYLVSLELSALCTLVVFQFFHIYESIRAKSLWQHIKSLTQALVVVLMLLAGLAFLTKTGEGFSRSWFLAWSLFAFILLLFFRGGLLVVLRLMRSHGLNERCVIIVGAGKLAERLTETMQQALWTGFHIVAIFDDHPEEFQSDIAGVQVLKTPQRLNDYLDANKQIDEVWLAMPIHAEARIKEILHELRHHTIAVRLALDLVGFGLTRHSITDVDGFPMLNLNASPMVGMNRFVKAIEDRVLAALILIFISPLFLLIACLVKLTSKGPIFFKQLRHGWDGRVIKIYKFRTMFQHSEAGDHITQATQHDSRITPLGKFLRRTSLDELPQFINVLQGRMSIVGPRPHAIVHNEFYKDAIVAYMQRHKVKPGITGWAQVNGWRGETDTIDKMQGRVDYDLYYIENWSLVFDIKIILLTIFQGFIHRNAY